MKNYIQVTDLSRFIRDLKKNESMKIESSSEGKKARGQEGRKAGGQEVRKAGRQEGKRAGWQEGKSLFSFFASKLPSYPASKPPSYLASKLPNYLATKLPSYPASKSAFSVMEIMVGLLVVSILLAAFTPIISKKLKLNSVIVEQPNTLTNNCFQTNATGAYHFGEREGDCTLCSKTACLMCNLEETEGSYIDSAKCRHISCSDTKENGGFRGINGETCSACDKSKCAKCDNFNGSTSYYDTTNKQCAVCNGTDVCDGVNKRSCAEKSFCENGVEYSCLDIDSNCTECNKTECSKCINNYSVINNACINCQNSTKYGSSCTSCDKDKCLTCSADGYWDKNGLCQRCGNKISGCGGCTYNANTDTASCSWCWNTSFLNNEKTCTSCGTAFGNACDRCSSSGCNICAVGYFIDNEKKCQRCDIENCYSCKDGEKKPKCENCYASYYWSSSSNKCESCSKFDNCLACNENQCTTCASDYYLNSSNTCVPNDSNFRCSGTDFMRIGNLCITRRNMGDGLNLKIPNTVKVANVGEYCFPNADLCCWYSGDVNCDSSNGSYSGCKRTLCDYNAANKICQSFNYGGKTWRLAKREEMENWFNYSYNLGDNGLMLCDTSSGFGSSKCNGSYEFCKGSSGCLTPRLWAENRTEMWLSNGVWLKHGDGYAYGLSVRCVTEMDD